MKDLSIEEKARRYDEALKRARKIENGEPLDVPDGTSIPVAIFPELYKSEDEKIKNWIVAKLTQTCRNATGEEDKDVVEKYYKACAWLEKQGEHHIVCSEEQMKVLDEVLNFAANHESPYWNNYIFETLNNLIRQFKN